MRIKKLINLSNIKIDREPINSKTYALAKYLEGGGEVPPIKVKMDDGQGHFTIIDGRHRVLAFKLIGRTEILAKFGFDPLLGLICPHCGKVYEAQALKSPCSEAHTTPRTFDPAEA